MLLYFLLLSPFILVFAVRSCLKTCKRAMQQSQVQVMIQKTHFGCAAVHSCICGELRIVKRERETGTMTSVSSGMGMIVCKMDFTNVKSCEDWS